MKVKTAVARIWEPIQWFSSTSRPTYSDYLLSASLLKKYQRKFGNRHFNQYLRTYIKNGLWETGEQK